MHGLYNSHMLWLVWTRRDRASIVVKVVIIVYIVEIMCACSFIDKCIDLVCTGDIRRANAISSRFGSLNELRRGQFKVIE